MALLARRMKAEQLEDIRVTARYSPGPKSEIHDILGYTFTFRGDGSSVSLRNGRKATGLKISKFSSLYRDDFGDRDPVADATAAVFALADSVSFYARRGLYNQGSQIPDITIGFKVIGGRRAAIAVPGAIAMNPSMVGDKVRSLTSHEFAHLIQFRTGSSGIHDYGTSGSRIVEGAADFMSLLHEAQGLFRRDPSPRELMRLYREVLHLDTSELEAEYEGSGAISLKGLGTFLSHPEMSVRPSDPHSAITYSNGGRVVIGLLVLNGFDYSRTVEHLFGNHDHHAIAATVEAARTYA